LDLHLTGAQPTPEEIAAIDAELAKGDDRPERHQLLPVLHALHAHIGWISPGAVNHTARRMGLPTAEIYGVASFYGMFSLEPRPAVVAHVCDDIACHARGAEALCHELERKLGPSGSACREGRALWQRSACLGLCERAPAALVTLAGKRPQECVVAPAMADTIGETMDHLRAGSLPLHPDVLKPELSVPQAGSQKLHLLRRVGAGHGLAEYQRDEGYEALSKAFDLGPEGVIREVSEAKLLGRGGAAFPAAKKWEALHAQRRLLKPDSRRRHYLICNADESEPGTFKDRILMEGDPFAVIEGMTIAALATGAERGYIYLRGEYPLAAEHLTHAIRNARAAGLLGEDILGRGLNFDIELRRGAGAYICGEETALFNSIEGYRGEPRNKPPFPTQSGLFHQPTVVNNVETLVNIPLIIREGGAAYARVGTANSTGYRLFCLSGHVARPGVYEVPMGVTLRSLIELAGGVAGNGRLQAVLLGGAAGAFVSPRELDTPLTFEDTRAIGATLGSGVVMLFDDSVDLKKILLRIAEFFRHETCGQCVPCRVGVVRQEEALQRLAASQTLGSATDEIALLRQMGQAMRDASICGLGQTASSAIESALARWSLFA